MGYPKYMRYIILFSFVTLVTAIGFQNCAQAPEAIKSQAAQMKANQERIEEIRAGDYCASDEECRILPFGSKACGGPREFIVHSSTANWNELESLVLEYNEFEHQHNISTGAISTCDMPAEPTNLRCVNNKCLGN